MINNRQQTGRRRGRGGQNGQRQQNGRPEMGNRIDNRARGNAPQLLEKYKTLARDAQQSGDRVLAEYYFQFADHYFRVLAESRARYEEANPNRPRQDYGDSENEGFDGEGNEGDSDGEFDAPREARPLPSRQDSRSDNRPDQQPRQYRDDRPRNDQSRDDRPRNDQNRSDQNRNDQPRVDRDVRPERTSEDRPQRNDRYQRDDRPREDRPREDRPREDRPREDRPRDERPREDRPRDERPREERPRQNRNRTAAPRAQASSNGVTHDDDFDQGNALPFDALPPAIGVSAMEPVKGVEGEAIAVPKKRGRPRKVVTEVTIEE